MNISRPTIMALLLDSTRKIREAMLVGIEGFF